MTTLKLKKDQVIFLIIILLLVPMMQPTYEALLFWMGERPARLVGFTFSLCHGVSFLIILFLFIYKIFRRKYLPKLCTWLFFGINVIYLIATVRSQAFQSYGYSFLTFCAQLMSPLALFLLAEIFADRYFRTFIRAVYYYVTFQSLIAAATVYLYYPTAMYGSETNRNYYIFGLDNVAFLYAMNGFIACVAYYRSMNRRIGKCALLAYAFIGGAYLYCRTSTGSVCVLLLILFCFLYDNRFIRQVMTYKKSLILCAAGMLLIIFSRSFLTFINTNTGLFDLIALIDDGGKNATLHSRIPIWETALGYFHMHPVVGLGIYGGTLSKVLLRTQPWGGGVGHMHNALLEFTIKGGLLGLILFVGIFVGCIGRMRRNKSSRLVQAICLLLPVFALAYSFEYRIEDMTFWIIVICMYFGSEPGYARTWGR